MALSPSKIKLIWTRIIIERTIGIYFIIACIGAFRIKQAQSVWINVGSALIMLLFAVGFLVDASRVRKRLAREQAQLRWQA